MSGLASIVEASSREAAERARRGHSVRITGQDSIASQGLLAVARHLGDQCELMYLPRKDADRVSYSLLDVASRCGRSAEVVGFLERAALGEALSCIDEALAGRPIVVCGVPEPQTGEFDVAAVFASEWRTVQSWLKRRTCVSSAWGREQIELRTDVLSPTEHWQAMWVRANRDAVTFKLMSAVARLTGLALSELPGDSRSLADMLKESLSDDLRDLLLLLEVQGRPLSRAVIAGAELAATPTIEQAFELGLIQGIRSNVALDEDLARVLIDQRDAEAERDQLHEVLAAAFESHFAATTEGLSALEAQRHFASTGRVEEALRFGRFGVGTMIEAGRTLSLRRRYAEASRAYETALTLHERGAPVESRARAYARHYYHYNRYKADEETLDETRAGYEASLADWRENALFWSRLIRAEALCGDLVAARIHQAEAIVLARDTHASARYVYDRVVDRLRERGYWSEAVSLCKYARSHALELLLDALARPRDVYHLAGVDLARATPLTLTRIGDRFACAIPGFTEWAGNPADAMDALSERIAEGGPPVDPFELAREAMGSHLARAREFGDPATREACLSAWRDLGPGALLWLREAERREEPLAADPTLAALWRALCPSLLPKLVEEIELEPQIHAAVEALRTAGFVATRSSAEDVLIVGGTSVDDSTGIKVFAKPFVISRTPHHRFRVRVFGTRGPREWEDSTLSYAAAQVKNYYETLT